MAYSILRLLPLLQVQDVYSDDVYTSYSKPQNLTNNQCGIVIDAVQPSQIKQWMCIVYVGDKELTASRHLVLRKGNIFSFFFVFTPESRPKANT